MSNSTLSDEIAVAYWAKEGETSYEQLVDRVVDYLFAGENTGDIPVEEYKELLLTKKFLPNSPCWMNAGTERKSLAACFVLPIEDNMESIFNTARDMALIMKEGGGVGVGFSRLRPEDSPVKKTKGVSSGPISFLKVYNQIVDTVKQGGTRRGAALGNIRVDHPDILKFISCKKDEGDISNFNLSIAITDDFMESVIFEKESFDLWHPVMGDKVKTIDPNIIMDAIVDGMWANGEPGIQFIDTVNKMHMEYLELFKEYNINIETSNPCSEAFLAFFESCLLGAINLWKFVIPSWHPDNNDLKSCALLDIKGLKKAVVKAVHFLNKMLDKTIAPLPEINERTTLSRKIGLGVMGLADILSAAGLKYGSPEAIAMTNDILKEINSTAEEVSKSYGYDNAMITLIAPTGTTGLVGGASQGIEPHFRLRYKRNSVKLGEIDMHVTSLQSFLRTLPDKDKKELVRILDDNNGSFPEGHPLQSVWPTAQQITPMEHLKMLAAVQRNVHNAVSKTINLPRDYSKSDLRELIIEAYRLGIKGFTVYREGSRDSEVLYTNESAKMAEEMLDSIDEDVKPVKVVINSDELNEGIVKRDRPGITKGSTVKAKIGCGSIYITTNKDEKGPCEVFTNLGRTGGCPSQSEATSRLISLCLRSGVEVNAVVDQLVGIRCLSTLAKKDGGLMPGGKRVLSCPDAIGKALEEFNKSESNKTGDNVVHSDSALSDDGTDWRPKDRIDMPQPESNKCPKCSMILQHTGGCLVCNSCGWSKCG